MSERPEVIDRVHSPTWDGPAPTVSALVATYGRPDFLPGLIACLEAQDLPLDDFEFVVVDNGSTDNTWDVLTPLVQASPARAAAVRLDRNRGPGPGRNRGVEEVRAPLLAITDDDCLPTPAWLGAMRDALAAGASVVQGAVFPDPAGVDDMGPWDHTKTIRRPTPFFETCNVAYTRAAFRAAGGFDEDDPLLHPPSGRAFGEDACLAWTVQEQGGEPGWAPDAVVHHRCIPSTFSRWLDDQRELAGFPGLAKRSPLIADWLYKGVFLDRRSAKFDLALAGTVAAVATRRVWPLALALPWLRLRAGTARHRTDDLASFADLLARYTVSDAVAFAAMARGSIEHRRLVL